MYYLLSEQFPSIVIACFYNSAKGKEEENDTVTEVEKSDKVDGYQAPE